MSDPYNNSVFSHHSQGFDPARVDVLLPRSVRVSNIQTSYIVVYQPEEDRGVELRNVVSHRRPS